MADTVTAKMALVKPEVGGSPDTWGNKWNANADKIDSIAVRNTAQWTVTPGDDTPASSAGPWILSRYGNDTLKIDEPMVANRQTGEVTFLKLKALVTNFVNGILSPYIATPATPAAGFATVYVNAQGQPVILRSDGSVEYLGVPPGAITYTGAATADPGWALLNGQAISRAANPVLFARYGTAYGAGDGSNTFNLPDAKGCVFAHVDGGAGRLTSVGLGVPSTIGNRGGDEKAPLMARSDLPNVAPTFTGNAGTVNVTGSFSAPYIANQFQTGTAPNPCSYMGNTTYNVSSSGSFTPAGTIESLNGNVAQTQMRNVQPTLVMNAQVKLG